MILKKRRLSGRCFNQADSKSLSIKRIVISQNNEQDKSVSLEDIKMGDGFSCKRNQEAAASLQMICKGFRWNKTPVLHLGMDVGRLLGSDCWHQAATEPEEVPAPGGVGVETTS